MGKKKKDSGGAWYHSSTTASFGEIFYLEDQGNPEGHDRTRSVWGPFDSFTEAKKDAIEYFRTDVLAAQEAIAAIRLLKKPKES